MIILLFGTLLVLLALFKGKFIRKHNLKIYIGATILAIIVFVFNDKAKVFNPFIEGFVGLSFFYVVMLVGALKDKSKLRVKLFGLRREYSIIGFILITPHATKYLLEWLEGEIAFPIWGILGYGIMLPLFITSFYKVRKKMSRYAWVALQKLAYVAYIALFIHLITTAEMPNLAVYLVLFIGYFILKIHYEILKYFRKKKLDSKS